MQLHFKSAVAAAYKGRLHLLSHKPTTALTIDKSLDKCLPDCD